MPRPLLVLAGALLLAACSTGGDAGQAAPRTARADPTADPTAGTPAASPSTTVPLASTATTVPSTAATTGSTAVAPQQTPPPPTRPAQPGPGYRRLVATEEYAPGLEVDVHAPPERGPWPVVVTVHGGGWFLGSRGDMAGLADELAEQGVVAFNASYRTVSRGGSFPGTVDDVACAVAFARAQAGRFTTSPERVYVVGHSAGAHLGALVALAPGEFGEGCASDPSRGADGLIGLAGPYDTDRLDFLLAPFFGTRLEEDPVPWRRGNPLSYAAAAPSIPVLLLHGDADDVVPPAFSEDLAAALTISGHEVGLSLLPGVDHMEVASPEVVAELISTFLLDSVASS